MTPYSPFTVSHNVGIVASYSYNEIVKPAKPRVHRPSSIEQVRDVHRTVHLAFILHQQERIKIQVAKEPDIRPNQGEAAIIRDSSSHTDNQNILHTPVELEILEELVFEEERRVVTAWDVNPSGQSQWIS